MKYYIRLLILLIVSRSRTAVPFTGPCVTPLRVWPNDLDVFMHMNNGAYLTIMDLARTDMMIRSGMLSRVFKRRWYGVVAAETIRFKQSLKLFQSYEIHTEVVCWDHWSFYIVQTFTRNGTFVAKAVVEIRFLSTSGEKITANEVTKLMGIQKPSPPMPDWIADWQRAQPAMSGNEYLEE